VTHSNYMDVEDLEVYKKLCRLHIDVSELTHKWPLEEKYVEWIRENIGAESPRARTPLAVS
jgi:hypothetical protein